MNNAVQSSFTRRVFLGGALLTAGGMLAACAPGGGGGAAGGGGGSTAGPTFAQPAGNVPAEYAKRVRVVAWTQWGGVNGETFAALVEKFNKEQEDVYLDLQVQTGSYDDLAQKLAAGIQAKQTPDLFSLSADLVGGMYLSGVLEPLEDRFGKDLSNFNEAIIDSSRISGSLWRLPIAGSTPVMVYNKEIFAQGGLPDRAPETWTEMRQWADQLKGLTYNGSSTKMIAYNQAATDYLFQNVLWSFGGAYSDGLDIRIAEENSIAAGEFQRSLVHDAGMAYMTKEAITDFTNGLVATAHISSANIATALTSPFEVGAAMSPMEKERHVPAGGGGLSIVAGAPEERKAAAFEFLKFLSQPENAATWSIGTGYMPIATAALEDPIYLEGIKARPQLAVPATQLEFVRKQDDIRMFVNTASGTIDSAMQRIYSTQDKTKDVFTDLQGELEKAAESIRKSFEEKVS